MNCWNMVPDIIFLWKDWNSFLIETGTKEKQIAQYEYFIDNNSGEWF
jgi:hypothetical protein